MPKIQASTVAEHRAAQRAALLDAARGLLSRNPAEQPPSLAEVARRAGLARSSAYSYFRSREDLLDALIADTFPRWSAYVTEQMDRQPDAGRRVLAYVDANLHLVARGDHALVRALAAAGRPDTRATSSKLLHDELRTPLEAALRAYGAPDPVRMAEVIQSVVFALTRMIEDGTPERTARRLAHELLGPYLGG